MKQDAFRRGPVFRLCGWDHKRPNFLTASSMDFVFSINAYMLCSLKSSCCDNTRTFGAICRDDVTCIHRNSVTHYGNPSACDTIMSRRSSRGDAASIHGEADLAQIGNVTHRSVDHR